MDFPFSSIEEYGAVVRQARKHQGLSQLNLAALCGTGTRFISDLENGKPTLEMGKAIQVAQCLGLELYLRYDRGTNEAPNC